MNSFGFTLFVKVMTLKLSKGYERLKETNNFY